MLSFRSPFASLLSHDSSIGYVVRMTFSDVVASHRSIRKYKSDPIPEPLLQKVLAAALRGSSSGNMQSYSIIITTDKQIKERLFEPHFKQKMVLEAPVVMTFCSDFHRMRVWLKERDAKDNFDNFMSFMIGTIDAVIAAQNAVLTAESLGLGICYMGTTLASCGQIAKILNCPDNVVPVTGFVLGYPDENPAIRDRLPLEGMIHKDTYQDYRCDDINRIYKERDVNGWNRYMTFPDLKVLIEESGVKNLAQVYTTVKYTKESHIQYSQQLLECLKTHDFFNNDL